MHLTDVNQCLEGIRRGLRADGADLAVEGLDDGRVRIRLIIGSAACAECLLPYEAMVRLLTSTLQKQMPGIEAVDLVDPR